MKHIPSYMIGIALLSALCCLAFIAVAATEAFVKLMLLTPSVSESVLPIFDQMTIPFYALTMATLFSLALALLLGLRTTYLYEKERVFTRTMARGLDGIAFSFLAAALSVFLLGFYLWLNLRMLSLFFYTLAVLTFFVLLFIVVSFVFFLLSDVVQNGCLLREDHDLTI